VQKTWRIKISRLSAKTYASVVHQIINFTRQRERNNYAWFT